jgi:hypothetical protein
VALPKFSGEDLKMLQNKRNIKNDRRGFEGTVILCNDNSSALFCGSETLVKEKCHNNTSRINCVYKDVLNCTYER